MRGLVSTAAENCEFSRTWDCPFTLLEHGIDGLRDARMGLPNIFSLTKQINCQEALQNSDGHNARSVVQTDEPPRCPTVSFEAFEAQRRSSAPFPWLKRSEEGNQHLFSQLGLRSYSFCLEGLNGLNVCINIV
jgi:hypothetical protein